MCVVCLLLLVDVVACCPMFAVVYCLLAVVRCALCGVRCASLFAV